MKKFLFTISAILICTNAIGGFRRGPSGRCYVDSKGSEDEFWYCGDQSDGCDGVKDNKRDVREWQRHRDHFSRESNKYWCCNDYYYQGDKWLKIDEVQTIQLDVGTCNYHRKQNICGQEENPKCTEPDSCPPGTILRNKECVQACMGDTAFPSAISNECIPCETTNYQGIKQEPTVYAKKPDGTYDESKVIMAPYPLCVQCVSSTHLFDPKSGECVEKDNFKQASKAIMASCFQCTTNKTFKHCVLYKLDKSHTIPSDSKEGITINDVKEDCRIQ